MNKSLNITGGDVNVLDCNRPIRELEDNNSG